MFCILSVNRRKNSVAERLFGGLMKDDYSLVTVPVIGGAPFYHLTVTAGKKGVDFERVIFEVGRCAQRLILDGDINLPNVKGIGEFDSDLLHKILIKNTASFILERLAGNAEFIEEKGIIFCGETIVEIGADKNDFDIPAIYCGLKPDGVEKYKFAAALYELCGVFSIGECRFNSIMVNGEKKNIRNFYFS